MKRPANPLSILRISILSHVEVGMGMPSGGVWPIRGWEENCGLGVAAASSAAGCNGHPPTSRLHRVQDRARAAPTLYLVG